MKIVLLVSFPPFVAIYAQFEGNLCDGANLGLVTLSLVLYAFHRDLFKPFRSHSGLLG